MSVIPFAPKPKPVKELSDPHWHGKARCLACGYEWLAIARVGTLAAMPGEDRACLACPECTANRGVLLNHVYYQRAKGVFSCTACSCTLFQIILTEDGSPCTTCAGCGTIRNALDIFDAAK